MSMRFSVPDPSGPFALLFPGQGAQNVSMLGPFRGASGFDRHYQGICNLLGADPLAEAQKHPEFINQNAVSSLLAVLASVLALELMRETATGSRPIAAAGYSVGQWTALCAAGAISVEDLFRIVHERARLMDVCIKKSENSGMLAVIGVRSTDVLAVCEEAVAAGFFLQITNDNAPNQFTLGGVERGLQFAEERLTTLTPKRLQRVPVAGAWHSELLGGAVEPLSEFLKTFELKPMRIPVIDNTTGDWLPESETALRDALARHVASPVLWRQGVQKLAESGAVALVEVGYGDVLTKYGFFINRSLRHIASTPPPRAAS